MSDNTTDDARPAPQIWPGLRYRDAPAALEYLTGVLGFRLVAAYRSADDDRIVEHAQLNWPEGGGIMIGSHRDSPEWPAQPGTGTNYVVTGHAAEIAERVRRAPGFEVLTELADDPYDAGGGASIGVRDPEGNLWSFGTYRGEPG
ncbi:VOC family protein [Nakamurella deserti]|uniref:VOC family protein n=1 Tax=Nakamurella deserti TaxID=2164074 RepID=UPI000DBE4372|nr:VOC family protein [Nakamurella deserti]